ALYSRRRLSRRKALRPWTPGRLAWRRRVALGIVGEEAWQAQVVSGERRDHRPQPQPQYAQDEDPLQRLAQRIETRLMGASGADQHPTRQQKADDAHN